MIARLALSLGWPAPWDGSVTPPLMGEPLGTQSTGSIPPGGFVLMDFEWEPPDPNDYVDVDADSTHFCLLSRIETSPDDPFGMTTAEGGDLLANVQNNNNIVWKNVTVVSEANNRTGSSSMNGANDGSRTRLEFVVPSSPRNRVSVFSWGRVLVDLGPTLFARWTEGGSIGSGVQVVGGTQVRLLQSGATLSNIPLGASEFVTVTVSYDPNVSSEAAHRTLADVYLLDLRQLAEASTGTRLVGGQRFALKTTRPFFPAPDIPEPE